MAVTEPARSAEVVEPPEKASNAVLGDPSVVVEDLHVTYRVYGGRRKAAGRMPQAVTLLPASSSPNRLPPSAAL